MGKNKNHDQNTENLDRNQDQVTDSSQSQNSVDQSSDQISSENVAAATPTPGNPYTVSADGRGTPYNPAVDGAPGEEAESKQAENDQAPE